MLGGVENLGQMQLLDIILLPGIRMHGKEWRSLHVRSVAAKRNTLMKVMQKLLRGLTR